MKLGSKHTLEFVEKRRLTGNPAWKGNSASIVAIHSWVRNNLIKNNKCETCEKIGRTDWSNKDHKYSRERIYWQELCRSCHFKYDYKMGLRKSSKGCKANRKAKVDINNVIKIREMFKTGNSPNYIAPIFNLCSNTIRDIVYQRRSYCVPVKDNEYRMQ